MLETYIQKGEVVVVHSAQSFDTRNTVVHKHTETHPDIRIYAKEKILVDDVRDFTYQFQKESTSEIFGVARLAILICDEIAQPAQHALLKVLEDMDADSCILIYTHTHSVFLSTVLSRVIVTHEKNISDHNNKWSIHNKTVAERFDMIKKIMKEFEDDTLTKQDIISIVEDVRKHDKKKEEHGEVYTRALSMLKQPSVSVKYVLEYVCALV